VVEVVGGEIWVRGGGGAEGTGGSGWLAQDTKRCEGLGWKDRVKGRGNEGEGMNRGG